jgi:hypothetical protein
LSRTGNAETRASRVSVQTTNSGNELNSNNPTPAASHVPQRPRLSSFANGGAAKNNVCCTG